MATDDSFQEPIGWSHLLFQTDFPFEFIKNFDAVCFFDRNFNLKVEYDIFFGEFSNFLIGILVREANSIWIMSEKQLASDPVMEKKTIVEGWDLPVFCPVDSLI